MSPECAPVLTIGDSAIAARKRTCSTLGLIDHFFQLRLQSQSEICVQLVYRMIW